MPDARASECALRTAEESPCERGVLADALRERTRYLHAKAERTGVIHDILRRRVERRAYVLFLRNLLPVYRALERGLLRHRDTPGVGRLCRPGVFRAQPLASDLSALGGGGWAVSLPLLPAGAEYAARVGEAAAGDGIGLVAHAYVRYMGDLNGGQLLRSLLAETFGLGDEALSFYDFAAISDLQRFKASYRHAIDTAVTASRECEAVLEEGAAGFELSIALSEAVGAAAG
jgi:heme oxygenase (biliverdin-producing, ferredoxin)